MPVPLNISLGNPLIALGDLAQLKALRPAALYDGIAAFSQLSAGASISTWADISGNGNNLTAGTAPTVEATLKGAVFNGTTHHLLNNALGVLLSGTQPRTIYFAAVYGQNASHSTETPWGLASTSTGTPIEFLTWTFNTTHQYTRRNDANTTTTVNGGTTPQLAIMACVNSGALASLYYNGVSFGTPIANSGVATFTRFCLGGLPLSSVGFTWKGTVYACVIYPEAHDAATVQYVTGILQRRYADVLQPYVAFFGDSVTAGTGASGAATRWVNLVAAARGYTNFLNAGVGGTVLQNTVQNTVATIGGVVTANARDNYITRIGVYRPQYLYILYGLNDLRLNDAAFTAALYQNDMGEIVDAMITGGMSASNIVIGSPPYMDPAFYTDASFTPYDAASGAKYTSYIAAAAACAAAKGTRYVDVWAAMNAVGTSLISGDHLHPNDSGHAVIASSFLSVL